MNVNEEAFEEVNLFLRRVLRDPNWGLSCPEFLVGRTADMITNTIKKILEEYRR